MPSSQSPESPSALWICWISSLLFFKFFIRTGRGADFWARGCSHRSPGFSTSCLFAVSKEAWSGKAHQRPFPPTNLQISCFTVNFSCNRCPPPVVSSTLFVDFMKPSRWSPCICCRCGSAGGSEQPSAEHPLVRWCLSHSFHAQLRAAALKRTDFTHFSDQPTGKSTQRFNPSGKQLNACKQICTTWNQKSNEAATCGTSAATLI